MPGTKWAQWTPCIIWRYKRISVYICTLQIQCPIWNSSQKICTQHCSAFFSFVPIGAGKVVHFYERKENYILTTANTREKKNQFYMFLLTLYDLGKCQAFLNIVLVIRQWRIPVAVRSKAWFCGRWPAKGCEFEYRRAHGCLSAMSVVCFQVERSLRRADHSSRGVVPSVVRLSFDSEDGILVFLLRKQWTVCAGLCSPRTNKSAS